MTLVKFNLFGMFFFKLWLKGKEKQRLSLRGKKMGIERLFIFSCLFVSNSIDYSGPTGREILE